MTKIAALVFFIIHASAVTAEENIDFSKLNAHQFSLGYVGFAGHISDAEKYMNQISKLPNAIALFSDVINDSTSTRVAKLYALCGMKKAGGANVKAYAAKILKMGGEVSTMYGDQMKKEGVDFFVNRITNYECN